jgi:hypothetical protein
VDCGFLDLKILIHAITVSEGYKKRESLGEQESKDGVLKETANISEQEFCCVLRNTFRRCKAGLVVGQCFATCVILSQGKT